MSRFYLLIKGIILLVALVFVQPVLQAEDLAPPKGHINISNSTIDEGHTGVVVFASKKGFMVVWSDDHNIKMQYFKKTGKKVGAPRVIHQNTVHKIHKLDGVWAGKWGAVVWTQDTGLGVSVWGMILNQKGGVQTAPTLPLTHGFGLSTRKFGSPVVSWDEKTLLVAFQETSPGKDIYCGKFTAQLARIGNFQLVKSGKDGTPHSLGAFPANNGWILSWTEDQDAETSLAFQNNTRGNPWHSFRKGSNLKGKSQRGGSRQYHYAWSRMYRLPNGSYRILVIRAPQRNYYPFYSYYYRTSNRKGLWKNTSQHMPMTWLDPQDRLSSRIYRGPDRITHWTHFWRATQDAHPNLWILHDVDGPTWYPYDYGRCRGMRVYHSAYGYYRNRPWGLVAYSSSNQERSAAAQVNVVFIPQTMRQ